jgi:hypothetical protein
MTRAIEAKQAGRWQDWAEDKPTPLTDDAFRILGLARLGRDEMRLLRIAILTDTHLQRPGANQDLPNTHSAYVANYHELVRKYLRDRPHLIVGSRATKSRESHG